MACGCKVISSLNHEIPSQTATSACPWLELSARPSTYQAGRVLSVGSHRGELRLGFSHFDQAMGLCHPASGIAAHPAGASLI